LAKADAAHWHKIRPNQFLHQPIFIIANH
jgi:hypothetical protein